jgi:hypothetical protein
MVPTAATSGASLDLPYNHICGMAFHMKTTLNIDHTVMAELKREAVRQGRTMSELVEMALRLLFHAQRKRKVLPPLPTFDSGGMLVDIADRDALYDAMGEDHRLYGAKEDR